MEIPFLFCLEVGTEFLTIISIGFELQRVTTGTSVIVARLPKRKDFNYPLPVPMF